MSVRLRLQRFGQKRMPHYRIVAAESKAPRDGRFIERIGNYNPIPDKNGIKEIRVNVEKARYWILKGAQPSDRVAWLFGKVGILPPKPVPFPNPDTFQVPKSVLRERKKQRKEAEAALTKANLQRLKERRAKAQAIRDERKEKRKQIRIAAELRKSLKAKKAATNAA